MFLTLGVTLSLYLSMNGLIAFRLSKLTYPTTDLTSVLVTDPTLVTELIIADYSNFSGDCLGKFPKLKLLEVGDPLCSAAFNFKNLHLCPALEEFHMAYLDDEKHLVPDNSHIFNAHPALKQAITTLKNGISSKNRIYSWKTTRERKVPMLSTSASSASSSAAVGG